MPELSADVSLRCQMRPAVLAIHGDTVTHNLGGAGQLAMQKHTATPRQMAGVLPGVLVAVLLVAAAVPASAKDYTVGDSSGWAPGVDYNAWAKGKTFNIGDTLLFQDNDGVHSVAEVSAADHSSCSASNPVRSYKDATTIITLTKPGTRYFICGTAGHCASGMKVTVKVASLSGTSSGDGSGSSHAARPAKPSSPGEEAPSDDDAAPAAAGPAGTTTTTRTTSNTSGATGRWARPATWLLLFTAVSLAMVG